MTKIPSLLTFLFFYCSCGPGDGANEAASPEKEPVVVLDINRAALATADRLEIDRIDSICSAVNRNTSLESFQWDTTFIQDNVASKLSYTIHYTNNTEIVKLVSKAKNTAQDLRYTMYYASNVLIKMETENREADPFKSVVYVTTRKDHFPKELTQATVDYTKQQAAMMYQFFQGKLSNTGN